LTELLRNNWIFLKPIGLPKLIKRINKQLERTERFIARLESEKLTSTNNSRNLPSKATIREEYVRCGKWDSSCEHGPYYYAYWKENGKLHKKYIGKYPPPIEKTNNHKFGCKDDESIPSTDPLIASSSNSEGET